MAVEIRPVGDVFEGDVRVHPDRILHHLAPCRGCRPVSLLIIEIAFAVAVVNAVVAHQQPDGGLIDVNGLVEQWSVWAFAVLRIAWTTASMDGSDDIHLRLKPKFILEYPLHQVLHGSVIRLPGIDVVPVVSISRHVRAIEHPLEVKFFRSNDGNDDPFREIGNVGMDSFVSPRHQPVIIFELFQASENPRLRVFVGAGFPESLDALHVIGPRRPLSDSSMKLTRLEQVEHHAHIDAVEYLEHFPHDGKIIGIKFRQLPLVPGSIEHIGLELRFLSVWMLAPNAPRKDADEICARIRYGVGFLVQPRFVQRELRPIERAKCIHWDETAPTDSEFVVFYHVSPHGGCHDYLARLDPLLFLITFRINLILFFFIPFTDTVH